MNHLNSARDALQNAVRRRGLALQISPVAAACALLLLTAQATQAQVVAAPTAAPVGSSEQLETVVVTGLRHSIQTSIASKRNSDNVVEVISAEDIGKLPDVSIAESLARLPGLAGQRVAGRVQTIQIRGLSGDFAGTLLNGRQQVTTGDNRGVEFDQFPSELINSATVYKTPDAGLIGQGLSGTIDMRTLRPLDVNGRKIVLNARLERNSNGAVNANTDGDGKRFSFSYVDQFADRTIGVALGFAHLDSPGQELHYKAWGFAVNDPKRDCITHPEWGCGPVTGLPVGATFLSGFETTATSRKQTRDGVMGVFEFKPSKDLHSTLDLYYSKFKKNESARALMGSTGDAWNGIPGADFSNVTSTAVGSNTSLVTAATVGKVANMVVMNSLNERVDDLKSMGWNTELKLAGGWAAVADLSYSKAAREENVIETYAGLGKALTTFKTVVPSGAGYPSLVPDSNFADAGKVLLSDPGGWGHDGLWKKPKVKDEIKALRLEGKKDFDGWFNALNFGINYETRDKDREMNELAADLLNGRAPVAVPAALLQPSTSLSFAGIPGVLAYDVMGAINSLYSLKAQALDKVQDRNYQSMEKVATGFVKLGLDGTLGSVPVRGNVGLQVVHTDQSSHGYSRLSGVLSEVTRGTTYTDVLPSLNLNFELGADRYLRLGLAKTMARGRIDDMRAGADISISKSSTSGLTSWGGSGGNPELQPWRAKAFDLSFEQYIGKRSYAAAAVFYKQLDSYIYTQKLEGSFASFPNTSNPPLPTPLSPFGIYERPMNGEGGYVKGVELSTTLDAGHWVKAMDGFGLTANASYTESSVHPNGPGKPEKLPGLSGVTAGLTVYYEKNGFAARLSERYRSAFRGEINGLHNAREFTEILADRQLDAQVSYEFEQGSFKGMSLLLQVNNLTNAPYATKQGNGFGESIAPLEYNRYGRQLLLGVSYRM